MKKQFEVDFFVIGAARAGTTSLYNYLGQHPDIFLPLVKECNYFSRVESMIKEVYRDPKEGQEYHMRIIRSYEVYKRLFKNARPGQSKGEVSPSYLFDIQTAQRIKAHNPKSRIVVSLRNPVERAYSHFQMHNATGYEPCDDFMQALNAPKNPIWGGGNIYLEASRYYPQLKPYYDLFPREQIHVMVYEEWIQNPQTALKEVFGFLGLDPNAEVDKPQTHNRGVRGKRKGLLNLIRTIRINELINKLLPRKATDLIKEKLFVDDSALDPLSDEVYEVLIKQFVQDIRQTEALTGIPLSRHWQIENIDQPVEATARD